MQGQANELLQKLNQGLNKVAKDNPGFGQAFMNLAEEIGKDGALSKKFKELIFVALAINNRCNFCIAHHVHNALQAGASKEEIYEAAQVAVAMGGGPSMAYTAAVLTDALESFEK